MDNIKARKNYLSWDETFMLMAQVIAQRSKDPSTQTGAVVVDKNNVVLGVGYNGWPRGIKEGHFSWSNNYGHNKKNILNTKYPYVVHAEVNAILNTNQSAENAKLYCLLFPCNECAKIIIQSGIKNIIYQDDRSDKDANNFIVSKKLFDLAGVKYKKHKIKKHLF
ncbi:MAG: hypothetical protein A2406_01660 [Candidatus Komeilibacteria bacterium RIFOXYC1_FULL_37_11]|uniref:CMP/dCMP-type deaminase domain-containing protein n=1 Tax=Candidatus Komeilibacteria bacterium RIFOXYC1_FULL_37_11 TaxID=1798555 RepID=A0A1G2BYX4_9BACT|nr:MAG: hypothetical protein A2406_01660 [Candidatus Komeilibacteria bacterium RIFOXYC1_FULL_37_11]OGY95330.1 MAG: hypothetical protein A2611_01365 [Candidatus Komeilibacteria bacterium RIFOXYD1_FULL_37_29]